MIDGKLVVFFKESKNNGCNFYRIRQPAIKIAERENLICAPSSELNSNEMREMWFEQADVVVTQVTSEPFLEVMKDWKGRKRFVIDWDDNLFAVSPYNPAYVDHGYKNVKVKISGKDEMLWKDGEKGFDITANKLRIEIFSKCLAMADMVTTTSPILSGMFKQFNKNVKVLKNYLDLSIWNPLLLTKDNTIRIGWQGGSSHFEDWHVIKEAMRDILFSNPNCTLIIMGTCFNGVIDSLPKDQVKIEEWVGIDAYPHKFKSLNLDIGIAPIENNAFNTCKSELKWEEYSSLEIPCVCSGIPPYSLNVNHGETGFLASGKAEWVKYLQDLIDSAELRRKIGKNAREYIEQHYDINKMIVQYEDAYKVLCNMKKELILQ